MVVGVVKKLICLRNFFYDLLVKYGSGNMDEKAHGY